MRRYTRWMLVLLCMCLIGTPSLYATVTTADIGTIPVVHLGRVKPLDTVARASLLVLNEKQTLKQDTGPKIQAIDWLLELMYRPELADKRNVFRIQNHLILGMFGKSGESNISLSFEDISPYLSVIEDEAKKANEIEAKARNTFQREIVRLHQKLALYQKLKNTVSVEGHPSFNSDVRQYVLHIDTFVPLAAQHSSTTAETDNAALVALMRYFRLYRFMGETSAFLLPASGGTPLSFGDQALSLLNGQENAATITGWLDLQEGILSGNQQKLASAMAHIGQPSTLSPALHQKIKIEVFLNRANPLLWAMVLYVITMIGAAATWMWRKQTKLSNVVLWTLVTGAFVQTIAIVLRMWLSGRPPVTNLYTSAVFVGWIAVLLSIFIERRYKDGIGAFVGACVGFCTLIIAHHLALQGDTMEMMQAVLDSNFWLATHVITICIGYGATFFAGALGVVFILRGIFDKGFSENTQKQMTTIVYGIVCFALVLSFIGTVLGGIWADQSWGRFWGWDPKENGALLIVLWNAIILHTRMGGYIKQRGLMAMAVFGNIVTSFSWFGVNLLGIGLHSYGFMERGFVWLSIFVFSQLIILWLSSLPLTYWRSLKR